MKNFKRIISVLLLVSMVLSMLPIMASAATATLSFAGGDSTNHETLNFSANNVTAVFAKHNHSTAPRHDATCVRFYGTSTATNSLTVSAPSGSNITGIEFAMNGTYTLSAVSADSGSISGTTWTGNANTVVFTSTAQTRMEGITVTYGTSGGSTGGDNTGDSGTTGSVMTAPAGTYTKVDASSLKVGDTFIIVNEDNNVAMSTEQKSNNRGQTAVTIDSETITLAAGNAVQGIVLQSSGDSSYPYLLHTGDGWLYAPNYSSGTGNYLRTTDSNTTGGAYWKFGTDYAEAQGSNGRRFLRYNATSDIFSCYEDSSKQQEIAFYKLGAGGSVTPTKYTVSWTTEGEGSGSVTAKTSGGTNVSNGVNVATGTAITMTITPDSGSTVASVTVNGTAQTIAAGGGEITFTVSKAINIVVTFAKEGAPAVGDVESGNYVIAAKVGDVYYAMGYEMSTSQANKLMSKVITVTNGTVNPADAMGYIYSIEATADGYTISNGEEYLAAASNTSTNLKTGTDPFYWNFTAGTKGSYRVVPTNFTSRTLSFRAAAAATDYYVFGAFAASNISAGGTQYYDLELIPVNIAPGGSAETFVKVENNAALGKGYYLIVCEAESLIFDASLETLDASNNYQVVTIADKTIVTSLDYAFSVDISAGVDQATIQSSKGYYIGRTTSSNGLEADMYNPFTNSLNINADGNAEITTDTGRMLLFNTTSGQDRFRYYASTNTTYPRITLYKCTTAMPGTANVVMNWSEEGTGSGSGTVTANVGNGASTPAGTRVTMTVTPNEGYAVASVTINGEKYDIPAEGGEVSFIADENTTVVITWEEIVLVSVDVDLKIISGAGKIDVYRNGEKIGSFEGIGGQSGKLNEIVYVGDTVKLVVYPGEAQRLISIENGGRRVNKNDIVWDSTLGAYTCEVTINGGSEAINFSFLPRKSDIGVVAVLATSFEPGKYVITGTTFDPTEGNSFDTKETYLLFGCDELLASGVDTIGKKAAALNLYEAGVTIQTGAPYTMEGLTKGSLYDIQPYGDTGYYTMQVCGMSETRYLAARDENELRAATEVNDFALWSVEIDGNGIATILNKATGRILKFNAAADNNQFRAYKTTLSGKYYQPVLYKATVTGYQVNYSKEGLGTVTAYNNTASASVASGSIQNEHSSITFQFTPAQYNTLEKVTVNGVDVTAQVVNGRLTIEDLTENIDVHAVFSNVVISNDVVIEYYVNGEEMEAIQLTNLSVFSIVPDLNRPVTVNGKATTYAQLTFEYSENARTGAMYANPNDAIKFEDGDTIRMFFLTSPVSLDKTAVEITKSTTDETGNGGDDSSSNFTTENNQDDHGNVHQTYEVTLSAQSSNWMESYTTGGHTDIIVILDNSLSMYDATEDGTNTSILNKTVLLNALNQFLNTVFVDPEADNRVSLITYHTSAFLHNSTYPNGYRKSSSLHSSFTYDNTFMTNKSTIYKLARDAMSSESAVDEALSNNGGTTNPESALMMAKQVAALRTGENAKRDVIVIMFTDGKPTSRLTDEYNYTMDSTGDGSTWSGGNETSSREYNETLAAGLSLKNYFSGKCKSTIYSVALLNALEASSNVNKYYTMVGYLYGAGTNARQWVGVQDASIVPNVNTSSNWKKVTGFSDVYKPIYTNQVDVQKELSGLFESIAYTVVPGKYVSIHGSVVDVIPPQFVLTQDSVENLTEAGWTITTGANGTTISHPDFPASYKPNTVTYQIECIDGGYGAVFTNTYASFTYNDVQTDKLVSANFYKPTVEIIPWTVDDHGVAQLKTDLVLDIIANDLFGEYTAGGHTIENYTVTLTDKDGNPVTYMNAVEQNGDPSTYFDAELDQSSGTVTFYTETPGSYEFYYVVAATVVKPDGSKEIVYSRVTPVDVVIPNVNLSKIAQEVTNSSTYSSSLVTDEFGNEQQLYLITLTAEKQNASDKIYNGVLTDKIPADFEFVKFVSPASNTNLKHENGVITWTGITATGSSKTAVTLQFLVRYTGKGYGTAFTNVSANFTYNFGSNDGPQTTQYFPVPAAGLNPSTVNDVDIAHSGDTNTLNVLTNDLFDEDGFELPNYPAGDVTVIITDENGNPIADPEAYYDMEITVNPDGTISYTAPENEGPVQFYYVVQATVTTPLDSTYAQDNSTTLQSRPTMVTVYTITDKYLVVDYGYTTDSLSLLPDCDVVIDKKSGAKLSDHIAFATPTVNGAYGTADYETLADDVTFAYSPKTMDFYAVDQFPTSLSTTKSTYVTVERKIASSVTVIPANNLFYEENFINFGTYTAGEGTGGKTTEGTGTWDNGAWTVEGDRDEDRTQGTANIVYGYDDAYKTGEIYSGGSSMAVTVRPTLEENGSMYGAEYGYFTFTGTGFDIYATCSRDTGVLIAEIYAFDEEKEYSLGKLMRAILIDTHMDGGENVAYDQLPVVMCHDLPYGRYTIRLCAYYHAMFDHNYEKPDAKAVRKLLNLGYDVPLEIQTLDTSNAKPSTRALPKAENGQYNVYVDSVRIYNPLTEIPTDVTANKAYSEANEINSHFTVLRDLLMDAGDWNADVDSGIVNGVLYIGDVAAGKLNGGESGTMTDDMTVPAPKVDGFYLNPTGKMKTVVENGKTYLINQDNVKATYDGCPIYIVYIKNAEEEGGEDTVSYIAGESGSHDRIGYRYEKDGKELELHPSKLAELNIIHYVSNYEAFGPKYEVHLTNGNGIAFAIPNQAYAQISAKIADEGSAQLYAYYTKDGKLDWYPVATVTSRTEMYYDLTSCIEEGMLIVKCVSSDPNAILSLCNLKTSGESGDIGDMEPISEKGVIRAIFAFAGKGDVLEEVETQVDEKISIGQQLFLESDLTMNFRIKEALLSGYDMSTAYLTVERDLYPTGAAKQVETLTIREFKLEDGVMIFSYNGISAAQMNDEMRVVLHIQDAEGNTYESPVLTASITLYAKNLLEELGAENGKLATLIMDMLNYGTAAQRYFDRHADAPANEAYPIFAQFADCATAEPAALENLFAEIENAEATAKVGIALELAGRVGIAYRVNLSAELASEAVLEIRDAEGKLLESLSLADAETDSKGRYVVCYYGATASQMRDVVYATVTVDGEAISNAYAYSISSYAAQVADADADLAELTRLMLTYGDAAKAYFG